MSYLRDNKVWEEEENIKWDVIELSKVDDKIIRTLVEKMKLDTSDLTDDFFIAFESLLKIGKRAENAIDSFIEETSEIHNFKVDLFNFLIDFIKNNTIDFILVPQLFHPDFITRARTIFRIQQAGDKKYLNFILSLLNDPDDSVRWAAIRYLEKFNMARNPLVYQELKNFVEIESNPIIKKKIKEILKKN